jgi:hypothetical protein
MAAPPAGPAGWEVLLLLDVVHVIPRGSEEHAPSPSARMGMPSAHAWRRLQHAEGQRQFLLEQIRCLLPVGAPPSIDLQDVEIRL